MSNGPKISIRKKRMTVKHQFLTMVEEIIKKKSYFCFHFWFFRQQIDFEKMKKKVAEVINYKIFGQNLIKNWVMIGTYGGAKNIYFYLTEKSGDFDRCWNFVTHCQCCHRYHRPNDNFLYLGGFTDTTSPELSRIKEKTLIE